MLSLPHTLPTSKTPGTRYVPDADSWCTLRIATVSLAAWFNVYPIVSAAGDDTVPGPPAVSSSTGVGLEEIEVTANRRSESLSRVPLAVSVLNQSDLTAQGIASPKDLTQAVPNLQIAVNGAGDSVVANIRGIQSSNAFSLGDPAVALFVNGISVQAPTGLNGNLYDLERVEVLRGPQGTIIGKNATAGSINVLTAPPTGNEGGSVDVSYGNFDDAVVQGVFNLPVSDTFGVRTAFVGHTNDGYFDTQGTTATRYDRARELAGRVAALWTPDNALEWKMTVSDYNDTGTSNPGLLTNAAGRPDNGLPVYEQLGSPDPRPYDQINNLGVQSRLNWKIADALSLTYLAGYGRVIQNSHYVNLGVPLPCTFNVSLCDIGRLDDLNSNYSHEFDLAYDSEQIKNIIGVIYLYQRNRNRADFTVYNDSVNFNFFIPDYYTKSYGVFDQATYSVAANARLTGGVRYSNDQKRAEGSFIQVCAPFVSDVRSYVANPACPITAPNDTRGRWSAVTFKVGLDVDLDSTSVGFASVSTGYKAGGLNDASPFAPGVLPEGYKPEKVTNYELGFKTRQLENRLQINIDAFYMDYSDLQVTQVQQPVGYLTINAASAKIYGEEAEVTFRPTDKDSIGAFANALHARYSRFDNAADQQSGIVYPSLSGNQLPNAPDFSAHVSLMHDFDVEGGSLSPRIGVYYQSRSYLREFNLPIDHVPSFSKTQLNLLYQDAAKAWSVEGYVYNLENRAVRSAQFVLAGAYFSYYNPPRTYGLRVARKF